MEHEAGLRARFVRNSIGGGSHDPRNWIGCVSRREETTTAPGPARKTILSADTDRESILIDG